MFLNEHICVHLRSVYLCRAASQLLEMYHPYFLFHVILPFYHSNHRKLFHTNMKLLKGIQYNLMLKLSYLELLVLMVSNRCHYVSLENLKYPQAPLEFATAPWVPWHTVWELRYRPVLYHLFLFLTLTTLPGHTHFN